MTIVNMQNLFIGHNNTEHFKILICASDQKEANEIAETYKIDSNMNGNFKISKFNNANTKFDCDYVLTAK